MSESKTAKVFWTGRSQEFRFEEDTVAVRREGNAIILEPIDDWPEDYAASFVGVADDFERPEQGEPTPREPL